MKNEIDVDILTNYFCNSDCEYCFLNQLRSSNKIIDIDILRQQLDDVSVRYSIKNINLYGGEISLLPLSYLKRLIDFCNTYSHVNVITNFSNPACNDFLKKEKVSVTTSINEERTNNQQTEYSLLLSDIDNLSLIQVVTPSLLSKSAKEVLTHLELFKRDMGFLPYSPAKFARVNYDISNRDFSNFMKDVISEYQTGNFYHFEIFNLEKLDDACADRYNPTMRAILFINPFNKYSCVAYEGSQEYFKTFDTLEAWEVKCEEEAAAYEKKCGHCKYYKKCYAEHLKEWSEDDECCGMKSLLEWYEENIY
jgi:sulfatase maturation enzyme AslB (radical SAM superfamily)